MHARSCREPRRIMFGWIGRWLCVVGGCSSAGAVMVGGMTAETAVPDPGGPYQVIRLGGQEAAIVPLADLRRLQAVERLAPAEVVESAEIESTLAVHREWVAAGRPGAVSHELAMAELLAGS
jgi:hypothetical protein